MHRDILLWVACCLCWSTLSAQDEATAAQPDPEVARIDGLVDQATEDRRAGRHEVAQQTLRSALAACLALPNVQNRLDAHAVLARIGNAALRARDPRTGHEALETVVAYRERSLAPDDPRLLRARNNLALAMKALGDLKGAQALQEEALAAWTKALPDDHPELQRARNNLASTLFARGQVRQAKALIEKVLAVQEKALPENHPDVQQSRLSLGAAFAMLGDLRQARDLGEKVLAVRTKDLPDDHPELQRARLQVAMTVRQLGDLARARALEEKVLEVRTRTLHDRDPALQRTRLSLGSTLVLLGNLAGARALLEKALSVWTEELPDQHPALQQVRNNLAATIDVMGDVAGARTLYEKVCTALSATLPDDHLDLQRARLNLAGTLRRLEDFAGARALQEKVLETRTKALRDDHPEVQIARTSLALTLRASGEQERARALFERVLAASSATLPDDHPDLQLARAHVASMKKQSGDLAGAQALEERVLAVRRATLPREHPDLQAVRGNLAWTYAQLGDAERAVALAMERSTNARRRVEEWLLAPRECGATALTEWPSVDALLSLAQGVGPVAEQPELIAEALLTSQALFGVETRVARNTRLAREANAEQAADLETQLRIAVGEVSRLSAMPLQGTGEARAVAARARNDQLTAAVREKERLQRALRALAAQAGGMLAASITTQQLGARLPAGSAAVAVVGYTHHWFEADSEDRHRSQARIAALVLDRAGAVVLCPLGARAEIEEPVAVLRASAGEAPGRGRRARPGLRPAEAAWSSAAESLRRRIVEPILAACGPVDTLYLSVDESLQLVPLDALPLADGRLVGERVALRPLVSLFELLDRPFETRRDAVRFLSFGGIDYGEAEAPDGAGPAKAAAAPLLDRSHGRGGWTPLPGTEREVDRLTQLFREAFPDGDHAAYGAAAATKSRLSTQAAGATFVHLATHGYFAPESFPATGGPPGEPRTERRPATGLSPLVLCGLALSGANLPPDATGRVRGIITAEEILALDLSQCTLVTLSACDTSLGVRRAGQGYASLRAALQGAGARYVLTSLWKVGDEATKELMVDFYGRLWAQKKDPHEALWEARTAARKKGAAFRDWAGWILVGR